MNFVAKNEPFLYKIRFENDKNATAPAQRVIIKYKHSEFLDMSSFKLLGFGFDNFSYEFSVPTSFSQMVLDYPKDPNLKIRFQAGLNVISNEVNWIIESLDVKTGQLPTSSEIGFLPPNNGTSGQGYVTFSLNVREETLHMSQINAEAEIIFDTNEPILTPKIFHTIDDEAPMVDLILNTRLMSTGQLGVYLNKFDNGSGVDQTDLFEYDVVSGKLIFLLTTQDELAILPLKVG